MAAVTPLQRYLFKGPCPVSEINVDDTYGGPDISDAAWNRVLGPRTHKSGSMFVTRWHSRPNSDLASAPVLSGSYPGGARHRDQR
jgi:hypothetical protein